MAGSPSASSPKVDERFDSHSGFAMHQEVFFLHNQESWIRGTITDIRSIPKKGGFAEVCFGCTPALKPKELPSITGAAAAQVFPLRETEIHHIVADATSGSTSSEEFQFLSHEAQELTGDSCNDLLQLSYLHDSTLLEQVRTRYFRNLIYTHIGPILLALNPYDFTLKHYVDANLPKYINEGDSVLAKGLSAQLPHAWTTAHSSYWRLSSGGGKNQSVIVSGESGAGKTETAKIVVKYLGKVSTAQCSTALREAAEAVTVRVNLTSPILEAFGNAKTRMNDNSSRFGKFMKVFFQRDSAGTSTGLVMSGAAIDVYLLEKSRIVTHGEGERSYHCFYQMLASKDAALRQRIRLPDSRDVSSLNIGKATVIPGVDDTQEFDGVVDAMNAVGMTPEEQSAVWNVVGGVLHLLQVRFKAVTDDSCDVDPASQNSNVSILEDLLGINGAELITELTTTTNVTRGERIVKKLRKVFAEDLRDALAKSLYEALFLWLVAKINALIQPSEDSGSSQGWIGLLDIFGFENFAHGNSFEQLCINLANETLQNHYNSIIFTRDMAECQAEGINTASIVFYDNQPCLDLICGLNMSECGVVGSSSGGVAVVTNKLSIMNIIDESCSLATGTDQTLVQRIVELYGGKPTDGSGAHPNFSKPKTQNNAFHIVHYAGEVKYTIDGFRNKNADTLKETVKDVLRNSRNDFVAQLFAVPAGSPAAASPRAGAPAKKTVSTFFRNQLISLMTEINSTHPHWIRCVKPHSAKKPRMFHGVEVMTQLRSAGVLETVRIRQQSFSVRVIFAEFVQRHSLLLQAIPLTAAAAIRDVIINDKKVLEAHQSVPLQPTVIINRLTRTFSCNVKTASESALSEAAREILQRAGIDHHSLAQVGKTKVFLRTGAYHVLTQLLRIVKASLVHSVQAYARGYLSSRNVRCRQLNENVKLISAFLVVRPSQQIMRVKELREREKELLTKFRNIMILQGVENDARKLLEAESDHFFDERLPYMRLEDLASRRALWLEMKREADVRAQTQLSNYEADQRRSLAETAGLWVSATFSVRDEVVHEVAARDGLVTEESDIRQARLQFAFSEWTTALHEFRLRELRKFLQSTTDSEAAHRRELESESFVTIVLIQQRITIELDERKARDVLLAREGAKFAEFPALQAKLWADVRRGWEQRKEQRDRYEQLVLQREEQALRYMLQDEWEQELILLLEEINESEGRALELQYYREAQEERVRLAVEAEARALREAEELRRFESMRKEAQELWNVAEARRILADEIKHEEATLVDLCKIRASLAKQFMEECRRREIAGSTIHSTRGNHNGIATAQRSAAVIAKSVERVRQQQVALSHEISAHEERLAALRREQALPLQPALHHQQAPDLKQTSPLRTQLLSTSVDASTPSVRRASSHHRSPSISTKDLVDDIPETTAAEARAGSSSHPASAAPVAQQLRQTSVAAGGSLEMLERLAVVRATAVSSNYSKDPSRRLAPQGSDELVPEFARHEYADDPEACSPSRRLIKYHAEKRRMLQAKLNELENTTAAAGIIGRRSVSLVAENQMSTTAATADGSLPPNPARTKSVTYCDPRVFHGGFSPNGRRDKGGAISGAVSNATIFPKGGKNPNSTTWQPIANPIGGVPGVMYCYLPDGTLAPLHTQGIHPSDLDDTETQVIDMDRDATVLASGRRHLSASPMQDRSPSPNPYASLL